VKWSYSHSIIRLSDFIPFCYPYNPNGQRMSIIVAPSVLSADFARLGEDIALLNRSEAEWIHIDVMDGVFVPNISFGFPVLEAIRRSTALYCDVHLMVIQPERYLAKFKDAGADQLTIHWEACTDIAASLRAIRAMGIKAGVAISPDTPVAVLNEIIGLIDVILVMSVHPGYGGQKFMPDAIGKIKEAALLIRDAGMQTKIEVDGGITIDNAQSVINVGADILVAGNSVFGAADPIAAISQLKNLSIK
jgi:ribulose-phosphate 3-epimerase